MTTARLCELPCHGLWPELEARLSVLARLTPVGMPAGLAKIISIGCASNYIDLRFER